MICQSAGISYSQNGLEKRTYYRFEGSEETDFPFSFQNELAKLKNLITNIFSKLEPEDNSFHIIPSYLDYLSIVDFYDHNNLQL